MDINTKISCIGTGAMGGAIIGALAKKYKNISFFVLLIQI